MEKALKKRGSFPYIIAFAALFISASAVFYSVYGLSRLFAGESTAVMIMASSLEFAKLVVASLLYRYWREINKLLRLYFVIACVTLMFITSGGIYGFLSGAYQEVKIESELLDKHVLMLETKQNRFKEQAGDEKELVIYYTEALSNPTMIQYVDKETQQLVTTTSSRQRQLMTSQLSDAKTKLYSLNDSIAHYDMLILNKMVSNEDQRELGPLKYVAKSLNTPMDNVVNYFILLIVFVFDPLAVCLVIVANFAFLRVNTIYIEKPQPNWFRKIGLGKKKRSFYNWLKYFSKPNLNN